MGTNETSWRALTANAGSRLLYPRSGRVDVSFPPRGPVVEPTEVHQRFPDAPVMVRHGLVDHPLFSDARLEELLRTLPIERVEIRAVVGAGQDFERRERVHDLDPVDAFHQLGDRRLWMNLHHVEMYDSDYAELMHDYVRGLAPAFREMQPEVYRAGVFILLSSPGASVHFHSDPDQSFLSQIRGSKLVYTYPAAILEESDYERLAHSGDHDAAAYKPEYEARALSPLHLTPGDAALLPLYAPHRVENDDMVSVSMSIGFHTRRSLRRAHIHHVGHELRARSLPVARYGSSRAADSLKHGLHFAMRVRDKLRAVVAR